MWCESIPSRDRHLVELETRLSHPMLRCSGHILKVGQIEFQVMYPGVPSDG